MAASKASDIVARVKSGQPALQPAAQGGDDDNDESGVSLPLPPVKPAAVEGWFDFNDETVSAIPCTKMRSLTGGSTCAYILEYRRREDSGLWKQAAVPAPPHHQREAAAARQQDLERKRYEAEEAKHKIIFVLRNVHDLKAFGRSGSHLLKLQPDSSSLDVAAALASGIAVKADLRMTVDELVAAIRQHPLCHEGSRIDELISTGVGAQQQVHLGRDVLGIVDGAGGGNPLSDPSTGLDERQSAARKGEWPLHFQLLLWSGDAAELPGFVEGAGRKRTVARLIRGAGAEARCFSISLLRWKEEADDQEEREEEAEWHDGGNLEDDDAEEDEDYLAEMRSSFRDELEINVVTADFSMQWQIGTTVEELKVACEALAGFDFPAEKLRLYLYEPGDDNPIPTYADHDDHVTLEHLADVQQPDGAVKTLRDFEIWLEMTDAPGAPKVTSTDSDGVTALSTHLHEQRKYALVLFVEPKLAGMMPNTVGSDGQPAVKALSITVRKGATLYDLKCKALARVDSQVCVAAAECRLRNTSDAGSEGSLVKREGATLADAGVTKGQRFILEPGQPPEDGVIKLRFVINQGWESTTYTVSDIKTLERVGVKQSLGDVKQGMLDILCAPGEALNEGQVAEFPQVSSQWRFRRSAGVFNDPVEGNRGLYKDESASLDDEAVADNELMFLERGAPLVPGQVVYTLQLVPGMAKPLGAPDDAFVAFNRLDKVETTSLGEMVFPSARSLGEFKAAVLERLRDPASSLAPLAAQDAAAALTAAMEISGARPHCRLRLRQIRSNKLSVILKNDARSLKKCNVANRKLAVEILSAPESLSASAALFNVWRLVPGSLFGYREAMSEEPRSGLSPETEQMIVHSGGATSGATCFEPRRQLMLDTGQQLTAGDLAAGLSELLGIPAEKMVIAHRSSANKWAWIFAGDQTAERDQAEVRTWRLQAHRPEELKQQDGTIFGVKSTDDDPSGECDFKDGEPEPERKVRIVGERPGYGSGLGGSGSSASGGGSSPTKRRRNGASTRPVEVGIKLNRYDPNAAAPPLPPRPPRAAVVATAVGTEQITASTDSPPPQHSGLSPGTEQIDLTDD